MGNKDISPVKVHHPRTTIWIRNPKGNNPQPTEHQSSIWSIQHGLTRDLAADVSVCDPLGNALSVGTLRWIGRIKKNEMYPEWTSCNAYPQLSGKLHDMSVVYIVCAGTAQLYEREVTVLQKLANDKRPDLCSANWASMKGFNLVELVETSGVHLEETLGEANSSSNITSAHEAEWGKDTRQPAVHARSTAATYRCTSWKYQLAMHVAGWRIFPRVLCCRQSISNNSSRYE